LTIRDASAGSDRESIPQWYRTVVAMTLRLTDEETEALRQRAEQLGTSMQTVAREAIRHATIDRPARLQAAIRDVAMDDAELLDRLSR
jgi:predicted transcriptional regulator